jgi:hypothetical protein
VNTVPLILQPASTVGWPTKKCVVLLLQRFVSRHYRVSGLLRVICGAANCRRSISLALLLQILTTTLFTPSTLYDPSLHSNNSGIDFRFNGYLYFSNTSGSASETNQTWSALNSSIFVSFLLIYFLLPSPLRSSLRLFPSFLLKDSYSRISKSGEPLVTTAWRVLSLRND